MTRHFRAVALFALLLTSGALPLPAFADNTADEADLRFRRGVEFYRERRFDDALAEFFSSNRLVKNRNVILNIARCYEQLKQFDEAYRYYNDVLGENPSAEDLAAVQESLARLAPRVALVQIETDPAGADIYVDRKDLGSRGLTPKTIALPQGKAKLMLVLAGHREAQADVELVKGATAKVKLPLEFIYGYVDVSGGPAGARIRVDKSDGEPDGNVPTKLKLKPGRHILDISAEGFTSQQVPVDAQPDVTREARVSLRPLPPPTGKLVVTANHDGALVKVDGRDAGFTPVVIELPGGKHHVFISFEDLVPHEEDVKVTVNEQTWVRAELRYDQARITAASKTETSVEDAPASITVITREQIQAFGYTTLPEALRAVRGVFVTDDRTYQYLGVRGFSPPGDLNNRILILYDGHALNDVWAGQAYVGRENNVDLNEVERIEVVRGPVSSLFGSAAFFGVINIVPRHKLDTGNVELSAGGGRENEGRGRTTLGMKGDGGGVIASFAGLYSAGESRYVMNLPDGPVTARWRDGEQALNGTARAQVGNLALFGGVNTRLKEIPTSPFGTVLDQRSARDRDARGFLEARYDTTQSTGALFTARAYYDATRFKGEYLQPAPAGQEIDTGGADWAGAEVRFRTAEILNQHLTVGAEFQRQFRVYQTVTTDEGSSLDDTQAFNIGSAYAVDELRLGRRVLLNGSARADYYFGSFGLTVNPRLAVIVRPYDSGITKLMGGKSFRAPTVYERFYTDGGLTSRANPAVGPENIYTAELEHTHDLSSEVRLVGAVFVNSVSSLIHTTEDSDGLAISDNALGRVQTSGAEAEIRWQPSRLTMISGAYWVQRMDLFGLQDDDEHSEEKRLRSNAPRHAFSIRAMFPLLGPALIGSTELVYNSPRLTELGPAVPLVGEIFQVNVGASGEFSRKFRYFVGVQNLLDQRPEFPASDLPVPTVLGYGRAFLVQVAAAVP